ncbi:hypothetical protein LCGC14_1028700 [marine sediment metagenome]|uniref:RNA polymerase sigma-70 region 4 domain-containing protein n=1 Tax=marine sediment metagenome TaxID=412755 RepID=A0A0F9NGZ8_9ZZZZ
MSLKVGTTYKLRDKARRNAAIIAYKGANPDATLREMGTVFYISHVRVSKILKDSIKGE